MLLERRLVILLQRLNDKGEFPTLESFVSSFETRRWPRVRYIFDSDIEFSRRITDTVKDNLGSDTNKHFIDYNEDMNSPHRREHLSVTARGRDLICWHGFLQVVGKEFSVTWALIAWLFPILLAIVGTYYTVTR